MNDADSRDLERIENMIVNSQLYFATPSALNDPFDCKILPSFRPTKEVLRRYYLENVKDHPEFLTFPYSVHEEFIDHMIDEGMHENENEFVQTFSEIMQRRLDEIGVCCFSSKKDDILMWSHYAGGHTGICLEFDVVAGSPFFDRAIEIDYQKSYPKIEYFESMNKQWMQTIFRTKSYRWGYENEYRILKYDGPGVSQFPEESLSSVILGCRTTDENKSKILQLIGRQRRPIKVKQARPQKYEFGLEIVEIG